MACNCEKGEREERSERVSSRLAEDAFDRLDRSTIDGQMKCKTGKPCNGRCIPRGKKCRNPSEEELEKKSNNKKKVILGAVTGGAALAGLAGLGFRKKYMLNAKRNRAQPENPVEAQGQTKTKKRGKDVPSSNKEAVAKKLSDALNDYLQNKGQPASRPKARGNKNSEPVEQPDISGLPEEERVGAKLKAAAEQYKAWKAQRQRQNNP